MEDRNESEYQEYNPESETAKPKAKCRKEPAWPLFVGSLVPVVAVVGYFYVLFNVMYGSAIPSHLPQAEHLRKAASTGIIWFGMVDLIYVGIAYLLDFLAVWGFARRHVLKTFVLAYSLRAWKLTGFLLSFAGFVYLAITMQAWLYSTVAFWIGLGVSILVAVFSGAAILELAHKVNVSAKLFFMLMLTELVAVIATGYAATVLFTVMPKF